MTSYERHLRVVSPMTDAPVARALRLVLNDEIEDWHAGERLVERLVSRPHDVAAVYEFLQRLEAVVVGAGATLRPGGHSGAGTRGLTSSMGAVPGLNRLKGLTRPVNFESSNRCARKRQTRCTDHRLRPRGTLRVGRPPLWWGKRRTR